MLQETSWIIFLSTIMMTTMPGSAFNSDRAENVAVTGNVNSALDVESKVTLDNASSAQAEITSTDKAQQIAGTKTTSAVEQMSPANLTRSEKLGLKSVTEGPNPTKEIKTVNGVSSTPLNIVVAITKPSQVRDDTLQSIKGSHQFAAEGTLQSCNCSQVEGTRYTLDDPLNTGNKMRGQDCEHFLRSNIASLLMWARDVKGMTTELIGLSKDFDETDEYNTKPTVQKLKPEIRGDWRTIDLGKPVNNEFLPFSDSQEEDEAAWKVFDMFSKVKWALFRSLLESLSGNIAATEESTPSRKLRALRSNLVDAVEELKSVENENGFILVASVPAIELDSALELLQREATQDTLLVVTRVCSHDTKTVPFFAQGPSANMLREATTIWDVPDVIRNIIAGGCQDSNCRSRRHDIFPPSIPSVKRNHHNVVTLKRSARDIAKKSDDMQGGDVSAVKDEDKNVEDLNSKNEEAKDAKAKEEISGNKDAKAKEEIRGNKDAKAKEEISGNKDAKAKEEISGNKDAKAKEEISGNKDAKAKEEIRGNKDAKAKEEISGNKDAKAKEEISGNKDAKAKEEISGNKDAKAKEEISGNKDAKAKEEISGNKDAKAKEEISGNKDAKAKEEISGNKDAKAKEEIRGNKDAKAKEEISGNKDAKAKEEISGNKDAKAKEEISGNKDAKAKEEISGNKDAKAKEEISGNKDAKAKEERDGGKDVMAKTERGGDKGVMAKAEKDGRKDAIAKTERDGGKGVTAKVDRNADKNLNAKAGKNGSGSFKVAEKFTTIISTVISMAVVFTLTL